MEANKRINYKGMKFFHTGLVLQRGNGQENNGIRFIATKMLRMLLTLEQGPSVKAKSSRATSLETQNENKKAVMTPGRIHT